MAPNWIETEASVRVAERLAEEAGSDYEGGKRMVLHALGDIPIGRPSAPAEIASLIAFPAADRAATITPVQNMIDGEQCQQCDRLSRAEA